MHRHTVNTALALAGTLLAVLAGATQSNELHEALKRKPDMEHGRVLYETCAACHQPDGAGVADGHIPVIAGQHYEVVITQLVDFRRSERVDLRMNAFAARHHLEDSQDIADVAAYISSMPTQQTNEAGTGQFTVLGAQVYKRACVTCHGADGEGNSQLRQPRLAGQHYRYLVRQVDMMIRGTRSNMSWDHSILLRGLTEEEVTGVADYLARMKPAADSPAN
ncbi:MAG: cytochrome C [Acidobacteria bacterium]|nr:MAG: cytochrome C [Acidobacteriota bacterium]